jgi:hypothetical protein
MGGWNSGGHNKDCRLNTIDELPSYDVKETMLSLAKREGMKLSEIKSTTFSVNGDDTKVSIVSVPRHLGGVQYFWVCPVCEKKCRKLRPFNVHFMGSNKDKATIMCQRCLPRSHFRYESQRTGDLDRSKAKIKKISQKLEPGVPWQWVNEAFSELQFSPPERPPRMRAYTYKKLCKEWHEAVAPIAKQYINFLGRVAR